MYRWFSLLLMSLLLVGGCGGKDKDPVCDPPCNVYECEICIDGECTFICPGDQICDGAGNCVDPSECIPACDTAGCYLCVDGDCVYQCTGDEVCDGEGNCVPPTQVCDPPCDTAGCYLCVDGDCVYQCTGVEVCDGEGNCVDPTQICDPPCDTDECYLCVDGDCVYQCTGDEVCDGEGNCVDPTHICDPPCDTAGCYLCVDGDCEYQCTGDEVCDGAGNCVDPTHICDPPCVAADCEECIEGNCVSYCADFQDCDGAGGCLSKVGGTCIEDDDCLDAGAFCLDELGIGIPGGFCTMVCPPDCPAGSACSIDVGGGIYLCAPVCDPADDQCRDGLGCIDLNGGGICWADCTDDGHCTTTGYCDMSTGLCECEAGYVPDFDVNECILFDCPAVEVFENSFVSGDSCVEGNQWFNAGGTGVSCTGWASLGYEVLFELNVPANTMVDIALLGINFDASLWVTTECDDFDGEHCVVGSDETLEGEIEAVTVVNDSSSDVTYFIIADAYEGCGDYELTIGDFESLSEPTWTYVVDFEGAGETQTGYASETVNLSGLDWDLTEVLIGTSAADFKNGARSARLRGYGTSAMTMLEDKPNGLGVITFQYRRYGSDTQVPWKVEYSINEGASWTQIGDIFTAPASDEVQTFEETVNATGNVRVRIVRDEEVGSDNRRLNVDDIKMSDFM